MHCWITGQQQAYNSIPHNFIHTYFFYFFLNTVQAIKISNAIFEADDRLGGQISETPGLFNIKPEHNWSQLVWKFLKLCWQLTVNVKAFASVARGARVTAWLKDAILKNYLEHKIPPYNLQVVALLWGLSQVSLCITPAVQWSLVFQYLRNTSEVITQKKMLKASSSLQLETSKTGS